MIVYVSRHALERARQRFDTGRLSKQDVRRDVLTAVQTGRVAKHLPSGFERAYRTNRGGSFCWTPGVDRAYVIRKVRDRRTEQPAIVVCTAILPVAAAAAEAA